MDLFIYLIMKRFSFAVMTCVCVTKFYSSPPFSTVLMKYLSPLSLVYPLLLPSLHSQSKEITFQLQEDLMKLLNELYTVSDIIYNRHTQSPLNI